MADSPEKRVALKILTEGKKKEVTFDELTLANNLAQEALVRLLIRKKVITLEEVLEKLVKVRTERYPPNPPAK